MTLQRGNILYPTYPGKRETALTPEEQYAKKILMCSKYNFQVEFFIKSVYTVCIFATLIFIILKIANAINFK